MSEGNYLIRIWMPSCLIETERSNKEVNSKGKIEERQWGSRMKRPSVLQNIARPASGKRCFSFFFSQVDRVRLSLSAKQMCFIATVQAGGQGPLRQVIIYHCNNKSNKKQFKETVSKGLTFSFSL